MKTSIYLFIYLFGQTLLNQWLPPTWRKRPQHTISYKLYTGGIYT